MRKLIARFVARFQERGVGNLLSYVLTRFVRIERHELFAAMETMPVPPATAADGEEITILDGTAEPRADLCRQLAQLSAENAEYLDDIRRGNGVGLVVRVDGRAVHHGFVLFRTRTLCLLGCPPGAVLSGNDFTVPEYRGRGAQARSVAMRIALAREAGYGKIFSETAVGNVASQKGLVKGGMSYLGRVDCLILCNVLVFRFRRPNEVPRLGWCRGCN